jgi:DNA invertase Pin-like site-specific DNA recombinase
MNLAGRRNQVRGSKGGNSKINENIAKQIFNHNEIARLIADKFGISISLVYAIKKKQIWLHIHE